MRLPAVQENMILEVARRNKHTIVVVFAGSALDMSAWQDEVSAIVWAGFCGEEGGAALADILTGLANPCGKLSETFPLCLEDSPSYGRYSDACVARYEEGIDVGYRYYDTYDVPVAFPFGFGLSYSQYIYSDLRVDCTENAVQVRFFVKNDSETDGKEIVQLYLHPMQTFVYRPEKELKAYDKIAIKSGEKREAVLSVGLDAFAYWSTATDSWRVDDGVYEILIGASSRDIRLTAKVKIENGKICLVDKKEQA